MKFYIYHRPLVSIRKKEFLGTLIHVSVEEKSFSPDGEVWKVRRCARPESVYNRLVTMLKNAGMESDNIYPMNDRCVSDLVTHMNGWEKIL